MKVRIGLLLLTALPIIIPMLACGSAATPVPSSTTTPVPVAAAKQGWEERWNKVVSEAKKEKGALIYMAPSPAAQRAMTEAFKQKFDLDLEFIAGRGAIIAEKVFAERRAGLYLGDAIIQGGTVQLLTFKPKDVLEVLDPLLILPEVTDPKAWLGEHFPFLDKDHTTIYFLGGMRNDIARNTNLVKEGEVKSLNDLLQPKWKGQIVMFDPTMTGSGSGWFSLVYMFLGREKGAEYMRQLVKQEPVITRDDRVIIEGLARGKYKLGIGLQKAIFKDFKSNGAPIEIVRTEEGNFLAPGMGDISVLKNAAHPNASIVFLNWLLTQEAQTIVAKNHGTPSARTDVPTTGLDPYDVLPPGEKFYFESEEDVLIKDEQMLQARDIFAPVMK